MKKSQLSLLEQNYYKDLLKWVLCTLILEGSNANLTEMELLKKSQISPEEYYRAFKFFKSNTSVAYRETQAKLISPHKDSYIEFAES